MKLNTGVIPWKMFWSENMTHLGATMLLKTSLRTCGRA